MMVPKPTHKPKSSRNPISKKLLEQVYERDGGICQYCGKWGRYGTPDTNIHHCVFGGTGRKRIHMIENLITLCGECHRGVHSNRAMREWTYSWSRARYGDVIDKLLADKWSDKK